MRKTLQFLLAVILGALRGRPVEIPHVRSGSPPAMLTPDGRFMPAMAGGDETPEEKEAREEAERQAAEDEAAAADAEAKRAEAERKAAEDAESGKWEGEVDKEKAERAVRNARAAEKAAKERAEAAEKRARELEQAQETEHETAKRERDEAKLEAENERKNLQRVKIDLALRDAAAEADVPAKKVKRMLRLIERDAITFDADGDVMAETAETAVADFLDEFPEFQGEPGPDPDPDPENPGGAPDRKRRPKELTAAAVQKMAKENPDKFNEMFEAGQIPQSALAGVKS